MNFFAHQDRARAQTRRMLLLFALAVIAIVAATDLVAVVAIGPRDVARNGGGLVVGISVLALLAIGLGSLYRIATLRGGGAAVARQLGATPVPPDTGNFAYRRLRNIVEEMAIASGVPVPEIFVLEEEAGINAFASGYAPADAAITVTRGALDKLTRDELQGVVGHEFSHVLNGDMRLNIRLMGVVFGILVIATVGRKIAELSSNSRNRESGGVVFFGLALFAVGYVGVVFARLIKASISRQREYLADASAVQFTRQPDGIAGALKKIGGLVEGSTLVAGEREEVAHMLFGDGVGLSAAFATHPPIEERIRRIDPGFDPEQLAAIAAAWSEPVRVDDAEEGPDVSISGFAPAGAAHAQRTRAPAPLPAADADVRVDAGAVARHVGNPDTADRRAAATIRGSIPDTLRQAAYSQAHALPLVLALALDADAMTRARQLAIVERELDAGVRGEVETLAVALAGLHPMHRLPLAALAFPSLRRRPRPQLAAFVRTLEAIIHADGDVSLHEYCLARLVALLVVEGLDPASGRVRGRVKLPEVAPELADLFALLAQHGHGDAAGAARAYALGLAEVLPGVAKPYAPPEDWQPALDRALARLDLLAPAGKELLVRGLTLAIGADGVVSVPEAELLRTVCAALHCPLPPLLQQQA